MTLPRGILATVVGVSLVAALPAQWPRKKQGQDQAPKKSQVPLHAYQGTVESRKDNKLVLAPGDGRELEFICTKETKYLREGKEISAAALQVGAQVTIEARQNDEGFLYAVNLRVDKDAPADQTPANQAPPSQARAPAAQPEPAMEEATTKPPPPAAPDPEDPGPPALKRGKPEHVKRAEQEAARHPAETQPQPGAAPVTVARLEARPLVPQAPPPEGEEDAHIVKAREMSETFTESLPNYMVQQVTTRYFTESHHADWRALDILSTDVVYNKGKESYRNIRINGKITKKPIEEVGGSVSWGEFGSTLIDLFSRSTNASFRRRGTAECSGRPAWLYDFSVELPNSHWTTRYASHTLRPAYKGSVWLDQADMRTLRIEMQARNIPEEYPLDAVEWVVEYGLVRIGTTHEYLVPVHAENLACWRGTARCARNSTDFRNYRRFTGESVIYNTESNIDFGAEPPPAAPPKKP